MRRATGPGLALLWLALPLVALAHAHLEGSVPAEGSSLAAAPDRFELHFSAAAHLTALTLQRRGEPAAHRLAPLPPAAAAVFSVRAPKLSPGAYELRYRVLSADGHVMAGSVHFTVTSP
jgi:methionine-rich copper-binding protein CopC